MIIIIIWLAFIWPRNVNELLIQVVLVVTLVAVFFNALLLPCNKTHNAHFD